MGENMNNKIFSTAAYVRLSREDGDKEESDSVGNQRKLLLDYIDKSEDLELFDIYIDDGYTGTNFKRPSFQKMISDIESGYVNCVIVKDLSRFGRDYIETGRYLERYFPDLEVRFISISDNIDSLKQTYDILLPIKNIFNEQYARDISKKVHTAIKTKQKAGEFIGAFTSYGYKKSPTNKNKLIIDDYAANIVRRIFSLYIQGCGKLSIAKMLNEEGVLSPAEYKKNNGENYKNFNKLDNTSYWTYSTIDKILRREIYIGNMVQGTRRQHMRSKQKMLNKEKWIVVENTHEPIIDKETWKKAQALLNKRTRLLDLNTNMYIFAGFVRCADCRRAMAKHTWKRTDGSKSYTLNCGTYVRYGSKYCTAHTINLQVLYDVVLNDLRTIVKSITDLKELANSQISTDKSKIKASQAEIERIRSELERLKKLKKSLYEDFKEELITKQEFLTYRDDYTKKEELFTKRMQTLEDENKREQTSEPFDTPWLKRLLELRDIEELDREIIVEMIDEILVYENHKIKIIYNFSDELSNLFSTTYPEIK